MLTLLEAWCQVPYTIMSPRPQQPYKGEPHCRLHVTDEKAEAQQEGSVCSRAHEQQVPETRLSTQEISVSV